MLPSKPDADFPHNDIARVVNPGRKWKAYPTVRGICLREKKMKDSNAIPDRDEALVSKIEHLRTDGWNESDGSGVWKHFSLF